MSLMTLHMVHDYMRAKEMGPLNTEITSNLEDLLANSDNTMMNT